MSLDEVKVNDEARELDFYIKNGMKKYNRDLEAGVRLKKMSENMFHN